MTNIKTTNRPIFDASAQLARLDVKDARGRAPLFAAMESAGATKESLSSGGDHYAELRDGVVAGWQGVGFAAKLAKAKDGETVVKGKSVDRLTGALVDHAMAKRDWVTAIASKVSKARTSYLTWCAAEADVIAGPDGKAKAGTGSGGRGTGGTTRDINKRLVDELAKLHNAVADEKRSKDLTCDRGELVAAFVRMIDLVSGKPAKK